MMNINKLKSERGISTLLLIIIFLVFVVVVGTIVFVLFFTKAGKGGKVDQSGRIVPEIYLDYSDENNNKEVKVNIKASTEDSAGINCIVLPDNKEINATEYEYVIKSNGSYTFTVRGNNGAESSDTIQIVNIPKPSSVNPYIPEGFTVVEGKDKVEDGFVIKDELDNEFVWIPIDKGYLENLALNPEYMDVGSVGAELNNSVAKYFGFYVGRYEASKNTGNRVMVIPKQEPWTNISYIDAEMYSKNMASDCKYSENLKTGLITGMAWDSMLRWIDKKVEGFSTSTTYGNYSSEIAKTGETESDIINNICDIAGNVREWTSETYQDLSPATPTPTPTPKSNTVEENIVKEDNRIVRSGCVDLPKTPAARTDSGESTSSSTWGFRVILYKAD